VTARKNGGKKSLDLSARAITQCSIPRTFRHLRSSLSRYLKSSKDVVKNKNQKLKPYYLLQHMDFLVPYTKTLENKMETVVSKYEPAESESFADIAKEEEPGYDHEIIQEESQSMEEEDEDIVYEAYEIQEQGVSNQNPKSQITLVRSHTNNSQTQSLGPNMPQLQPLMNSISSPISKPTTLQLNASQLSQITPIAPQQTSQSVNLTPQQQQQIPMQNTIIPITDDHSSADLNFFLALLPDVRNLNQEQKRKLRIGILRLIDELMSP
jgi:hypothetical protein